MTPDEPTLTTRVGSLFIVRTTVLAVLTIAATTTECSKPSGNQRRSLRFAAWSRAWLASPSTARSARRGPLYGSSQRAQDSRLKP
jgi:hypothetical protein